MGSFDPMGVGRRKNELSRPVHRLDEPTGISLGMVASPLCPLPFRPAKSLQLRNELPFLNIRFARDSAGTQTGQTRIVSCDRLVSTTIYAIWGLPINELYASGPCRPLIRYPSEANLSVIFRSKVE